MNLRFVTSNEHKAREVEAILSPANCAVSASPLKLEELQTEDVNRLVRDKVLKAFSAIGRPVFVEHTGLRLTGLNGFPGGLTQIFWDNLQADRFVQLIRGLGSQEVIAETVVGFCDGRKLYFFQGRVAGSVPDEPRGSRDFQWDCVFIPSGCGQTFAEMGDEKNAISMRRIALDKFVRHLTMRSDATTY